MKDGYAEDFGPFENAIWLNCAHQGALPRVAATEAEEAIAWKRAPWNLTTERFSFIPKRLREALGRLIDAPAEEIILGNSASYGLHLLANGIRWREGDEVLLMQGDFPSDILPWLALVSCSYHTNDRSVTTWSMKSCAAGKSILRSGRANCGSHRTCTIRNRR